MVAHIASQICMNDTGPAPRPRAGEIVADTAALLHGERALLEGVEDGIERVLDRAHHETVEQRDAVAGTGSGQDAATGQKPEAFQDVIETLLPRRVAGLLHARERARHAPPRVLDGLIADLAELAEAALGVPEAARDSSVERVVRHAARLAPHARQGTRCRNAGALLRLRKRTHRSTQHKTR